MFLENRYFLKYYEKSTKNLSKNQTKPSQNRRKNIQNRKNSNQNAIKALKSLLETSWERLKHVFQRLKRVLEPLKSFGSRRRRSPRAHYRLRLGVGRHGQGGLTRLRPGGGRIETASRRHRPPPCIDDTLILNCLILVQTFLKPLPNPPKTLPKSFQNQPQIDPRGFLGAILDQCFQKIRF